MGIDRKSLPGEKSRTSSASVDRAYSFASLSAYPFKDRLLIRIIGFFFFAFIKLIGRTVRFEIDGWKNWEAASVDSLVPIYVFWNNRLFLSTYFWQRRRIVIMTSQSFDGEYSAPFAKTFVYGTPTTPSTPPTTLSLL